MATKKRRPYHSREYYNNVLNLSQSSGSGPGGRPWRGRSIYSYRPGFYKQRDYEMGVLLDPQEHQISVPNRYRKSLIEKTLYAGSKNIEERPASAGNSATKIHHGISMAKPSGPGPNYLEKVAAPCQSLIPEYAQICVVPEHLQLHKPQTPQAPKPKIDVTVKVNNPSKPNIPLIVDVTSVISETRLIIADKSPSKKKKVLKERRKKSEESGSPPPGSSSRPSLHVARRRTKTFPFSPRSRRSLATSPLWGHKGKPVSGVNGKKAKTGAIKSSSTFKMRRSSRNPESPEKTQQKPRSKDKKLCRRSPRKMKSLLKVATQKDEEAEPPRKRKRKASESEASVSKNVSSPLRMKIKLPPNQGPDQ